MAKSKNVEDIHEVNETFNHLMLSPDKAKMKFDEAFELLDNVDDGAFRSLSSDYFTFDEVGQKVSFICEGVETTEIAGKTVEVVKLRDRDGKQWINGDKVLVGACKKLTILPCYIRVTYNQDVKNKVGTYKDLTVITV